MNKKILAVLIANTVAVSTASANTFIDQLRQIEQDEASEKTGFSFSGHIGSSIEYEHKDIKEFKAYGGNKERERTLTNGIGHIYLHQHDLNLVVDYALKQVDYKKRNRTGYYENRDSFKHLLLLNRPINLGNGWGTGLSYEVEREDIRLTSGDRAAGDNYEYNKRISATEQFFRPYLTYWNNDWNAGFYSYVDHLRIDFDNKDWGDIEERGYSVLFRPYMVYNNFRFELEMFYQSKDNKHYGYKGPRTRTEDFVEKYIEPTVRYSFDNAGVAYLMVRFTDKETKYDSVWDGKGKYTTDSIKTTVGYETSIGRNWMVKAEYEYTKEKEKDTRLRGDKKTIDNHKFYAHAFYRF